MASSLQVTFYMHVKLKVLIMADESDFIKVQKACMNYSALIIWAVSDSRPLLCSLLTTSYIFKVHNSSHE